MMNDIAAETMRQRDLVLEAMCERAIAHYKLPPAELSIYIENTPTGTQITVAPRRGKAIAQIEWNTLVAERDALTAERDRLWEAAKRKMCYICGGPLDSGDYDSEPSSTPPAAE